MITTHDMKRWLELAFGADARAWYTCDQPWGDGTHVIAGDIDPHAASFVCDCEPVDVDEDSRALGNAAFIAFSHPIRVRAFVNEYARTCEKLAIAEVNHAALQREKDELLVKLQGLERSYAKLRDENRVLVNQRPED